MLILSLMSTGLYVGLLVERRVNPPAVPIDSSNRLAGYSRGDAVLVRHIAAVDVVDGDGSDVSHEHGVAA